jgi:hypothetical protein
MPNIKANKALSLPDLFLFSTALLPHLFILNLSLPICSLPIKTKHLRDTKILIAADL